MSDFTFLQSEWPVLHDAASKADALFAFLQHRAFKGEL